eukprot:2638026-Amphidinium_carterae.1
MRCSCNLAVADRVPCKCRGHGTYTPCRMKRCARSARQVASPDGRNPNSHNVAPRVRADLCHMRYDDIAHKPGATSGNENHLMQLPPALPSWQQARSYTVDFHL